MRCPHCQHKNREGACIRVASGKCFASKCPACGRHPLSGATFCNHREPLQLEQRLLLHRSRWHLHRRCPRHTPLHLTEEILAFCAAPWRTARRARRGFTDVRTSMELLADWDLRTARHLAALLRLVRLKNRRPKRPCPVCILRYLDSCPGSKHACKPSSGTPSLQMLSMPCATPGSPRDRPRPTQVMRRPYGCAQHCDGAPERQCPLMGAHR
jgi:hypothetical protein